MAGRHANKPKRQRSTCSVPRTRGNRRRARMTEQFPHAIDQLQLDTTSARSGLRARWARCTIVELNPTRSRSVSEPLPVGLLPRSHGADRSRFHRIDCAAKLAS